jgi:dipeptidyl aminopeptidase/acylaminoacyl peptidase
MSFRTRKISGNIFDPSQTASASTTVFIKKNNSKKRKEARMFQSREKGIVIAACLILLLVPASSAAQAPAEKPAAPFKMTIDNIMRGPDLVGNEPSGIRWSVDGKKLYFRWRKPGESQPELYFITKQNPIPQKTTIEEMQKLPPAPPSAGAFRMFGFGGFGGDVRFDKDRKRALQTQGGDITLLDIAAGKTTVLISTDARKSNADFTFDQKKIYFTSEDNLFVFSIEDRSLRQMTSFTRRTPPPDRGKPDELAKWYSDQQGELFQQFKQGLDRRGGREGMGGGRGGFQAQAPTSRRKPLVLKENQNVSNLELSPDEKFVTFMLAEPNPEEKSTVVPNYVTRSGFTETVESHAKAGYPSGSMKAGIMDTATGEVKWMDFGQGDRKIIPGGVLWSPDGRQALLTARSDDRKDAWLLRLDPGTGRALVIEQVHDDAWIGDLGLTNIFWWPDSLHISYISEKDGFAHIYKVTADGEEKVQLTKGNYEVRAAQLSRDGKAIYLTSSETHPGEPHFYSMPAGGGAKTKITGLVGQNQAFLSPDESMLAFMHSATNVPPELFLQPNQPGAAAKRITLSTTDEFRSYAWAEPEVINFKARDGLGVYARIYKPKNPHPARPAVIFIHGAGYLQNAHKGWSTYFREYMFHNFLMEKGYHVFDVDYRGSSGYGRDCRTGIYRNMGGKDLEDIVDAAQILVKIYGIDPNRIGTYGGSYGGFLTLMAMFKTPGVFKAGAALRPVTDWAHYHAGYTVDILNLPQKDAEAYKRSSPIYFAEGLKGALLICHGMVDTNVHFQDTVRLAQRLIELGKENWEVAVYPVENHSFSNASSWTDEYKRIFKLFEENLK